jgi:hypothetical protein
MLSLPLSNKQKKAPQVEKLKNCQAATLLGSCTMYPKEI